LTDVRIAGILNHNGLTQMIGADTGSENMKGLLLGSVCAVALTAIAVPALSQTTQAAPADTNAKPDDSVETVIVTATRRKERLQDVPLSITTFSQKEMTAKGIVGFEGLARETPGVVINKASANFNYFTARGVATNSGYGAGLQNTVAIYVDEQPINDIGNTTNIDPNLFDVERVEFLRGPQGTLFGSGSLAGALRIIQKAPDTSRFSSSFLVDEGVIGDDSLRQRYNVMVNVPLIEDKLAVRAVAFYRNEDGYIRNVGTGKDHANKLLDAGGRVSLLWKPTDRLSVKLVASSENSQPKDAGMTSPALGEYVRSSDQPDLYTGQFTSYNATVDYQFDWAHFMSSTTYSNFDQAFVLDLGGAPYVNQTYPFGLDAYAHRRTVLEEARLVSNPGGKLDWTIGAYWLDRRQYLDYELRSSAAFLSQLGITNLPDEHVLVSYSHADTGETAIYGDLTYHFSPKFWLSAGLRYGGVHAQGFADGGYDASANYYYEYFYYTNYGITLPLTPVPIATGTGVKVDDKKPSYRFSLSYKPVSNLTTYVTVATGFRTPVVNAQAGRASVVDPTDIIIPYGAESDDLTNYEIGAKGRWFGGKMAGSIALYQIDWNNIQIQANRVSDTIQFATNIGGAVSKGLEWDMQFYPTKRLSLGFNGAYNDSKVTKLSAEEAAISGAVLGARLSTPHFQGSAFLNYRFNLTSEIPANWSLVASHVDSFPNSFPNTPGQPTVPSTVFDYTDSYDVLNTAFAISVKRYTVGVYVENLADSHAVAYIHPENFAPSRYARLTPRTVGVRLTADF